MCHWLNALHTSVTHFVHLPETLVCTCRCINCEGFSYLGTGLFVKCSALPASDGSSTCPYGSVPP